MALQKVMALKDADEKLAQLERLRIRYVGEVGSDGGYFGELSHVLATSLGRAGRFKEAFLVFDQALVAHRLPHSEDPSMVVNSFYNLAFFHLGLGLIPEFRAYADSCIHFSEVYTEKRYIGIHMYEQLATFYYDIGDYTNSLAKAEQGIQAANVEDRYVGLLYLQSAQAGLALPDQLGTYVKAAAALEKSHRLLKDDPDLEGLVKSVEAHYQLKIGRPELAERRYKEAIELYVRAGDYEGVVRNLLKLGNLYSVELKDLPASMKVFQEGLKTLERVNRIDLKPRILNSLALTSLEVGDYDTAISYLQEALEGLRISPPDAVEPLDGYTNDLLAGMLQGDLGRSFSMKYKRTGDSTHLRTALSHFNAFIAATDRVRWSHEYDQSKLYWREQAKETFTQALEVCYQLNDAASGYQMFEKSRAVMLQDRLNDQEARRFLSEEESTREKQLRVEVASLSQRLKDMDEGTTGYRELQAQLIRQRESYRSFVKALESKHPQYVEAKYGASVRPLSALRQLLSEGELSYVAFFNGVADQQGDQYIYALVIHPEDERFVKIPMGQYKDRVDQFLRLAASKELLNRNFGMFISLGYDLYQQLIEPLGTLKKRLIVSPDDKLLPLDLLVRDKSLSGSFLLYDHAVSYTYSAGLLGQSHRGNLAVKPTLLGFAPVSYQDHLQLPTLAGADFSLSKLNTFLSGCEFFVQSDATKGTFMDKINDHAMVVLYTHAEADTANQEAYLYFHDERLKVSDLQFLDALPTELIILSACNTGTGANRQGEGVFSLARGFAAAGIPTSVTTLWEIDSRATYSLTENFYQQVVKGIPMDEALRQAKLKMLQGDDRMQALPYFWGGSIVLGSVQPLLIEESWAERLRFWMVGIVILTVALVYWVRVSGRNNAGSNS
ncbi:MAG: CHAT domain-containing protein [Lunatimonas sp.]|uniref:CHAT domain-containing protein n=1 Tax=Lunatimonas sp. TaxID=2060141 RepID=UPI00263B81C5|nr:CHAT domain-containing tetratricopeptide repeat protein [Lunatimonas sp.]MCC5937976.1 CHAT domain-containing protein [Lunatimonas sp.]